MTLTKEEVRKAIDEELECEWDEPWLYKDPLIHSSCCDKCALLKKLGLK